MVFWYVLNDTLMNDVDNALGRSQQGAGVTPSVSKASKCVFPTARTTGRTAFDILEKKDAFELIADTPGLSPSDISVELDDRILTISSQKQEQQQPTQQQQQQAQQEHAGADHHEAASVADAPQSDEVQVLRRERRLQRFSRSFKLPDNVKVEDISAGVDKGVLTVTIPKLPAASIPGPRRIQVQPVA